MRSLRLTTELYEDKGGALLLFALRDGGPVWGGAYYDYVDGHDPAEVAATAYVGLTVQGIDPIAEGWEGVDDPAGLYDEVTDLWCWHAGVMTLIACSDWIGQLPLGVDVSACGFGDREFARVLLGDGTLLR